MALPLSYGRLKRDRRASHKAPAWAGDFADPAREHYRNTLAMSSDSSRMNLLPTRRHRLRSVLPFRDSVGSRVAILAALTLTACASTPAPRIEYRDVKVAIPVKCAINPGQDPTYPDTDEAIKAAPDIAEKVRLLLAGRFLRIGREAELKAAVAGCS